MLSSKKRKIIKLVSIGSSSIVIGAASTFGIVYSTTENNSKASLIQRTNSVQLEKGSDGANDSQNSNRDFNLPKEQPKPDNKPILVNPPEKKPEVKPEPKPQPKREASLFDLLAQDTQIKYVTYTPEEYRLDKKTPQQPNDPSRQTISDEAAAALYAETVKTLTNVRDRLANLIKSGKGAEDTETRDLIFKTSGTDAAKNFFDDIWKQIFSNDRRGQTGAQEFLNSINDWLNADLMSESKANRTWRINFNGDTKNAFSINVSFGYKDDSNNPVKNYYQEVNAYKVLGTPNLRFNPTSDDIINGNFQGWDKSDVTNEYTNGTYGIDNSDGIQVLKYSPHDKTNDYYKDKPDLKMFILDVDNTSGYQKFIDFINKVYENDKNSKIGVTLKNVGKRHTTRNVYDILKALPPNIETLTVFLDGADTTSLLALEDRNLRELNIYTTGVVNSDLWGINPLAIKHINFIPSLLAYNNGGFDPFPKGLTTGSTPLFTTLKFDRNDDYARVQEGLDIAFKRRSERIFQGNFQGDGAKPVFWDFADAPIISSLKNLNVGDAQLRQVRLSNKFVQTDQSGTTFVVYDLSDFNHSQWTAAMQYQPSFLKRYIYFGRGTEIAQPSTLVLRGDVSTLEREGLDNLLSFIKYTTNAGAFKSVAVTNAALGEQLKAAAASQMNDINYTVFSVDKLNEFKKLTFTKDNTVNAIGGPLRTPKN
ncbi:putative immunoglobulin-blocking virulence protein [Mycoplasma tullyi]|uniref:Putative immunoglobulin-blocking virulence protein n=1 Tax=Mycoplasma tullyi TaxID=1612150 RepID=A0A7D7U4M6_9MOLU|nr:putative immunoglobulin-blocking virulence protein [Mycoplasma tullyi]QMT98512.1 putative immunoglobulin-blocking virulence protein [Mycoplasma tullyi]